MLELRGEIGLLYGMSHTDDDHDYRSSENPLFLSGDGNNSSSTRLIVNYDYSDSPSLMMGRRNNDNISFSSKFSQATTTTTTSTFSIDQSTGDPNQKIIEFPTAPSPRRSRNNDDDDESDGDTSPPLWKNTSTNRSPTTTTPTPIAEKFPWQMTRRPYYNSRFHSPLTTTTTTTSHRSQEIARGRQELMEMIRSMPENSYELSLKDLIEKPTVDDHRQEVTVDERESNSTDTNNTNSMRTILISSREVKNENKARMLQRSKSVDSSNNGPFLLKMFLPFSGIGSNKNKKSSLKKGTNLYAKVSPKPPLPLMEGDQKGTTTTTVDKEWWKKRFSVAGHTKTNTETNGGMESIGESSSGSSNSSGKSRKMGGFLNGCWSIGYTKKTKTVALKGSDF